MPSQRYNPGYSPGKLSRPLIAAANLNPYDDLLSAIEKGAEKVAATAAGDLAQDRVFSGQQPGLTLGLTDAQRVYNDAAQGAYEARTEGQVRAKAAELGAKYTGLNPTDPQRFSEEFDAFAGALTGSLPEQMRPRIAGELAVRRDYHSAQILDSANRNELKRNADAIELGWKQYVEDAASAAQLGNDALADAALLEADRKQQQLVALGLISPETAALRGRDGREEVATRTLFRGFLDGHVSLEDVRDGDVGAGLSASARDRLVNRIQGEMSEQRAAANHSLALEERNLRLRSQDANLLAKKLDAGVPLSPDEQARSDSYATVPGLVDQDALDRTNVSRATSGLARDVATATPQQIEATIAEWNARPPGTLADVEFRKRVISAFEARQAALRDDPAAYASAVMPDKFPAVVLPASLDDPAFDAGLEQAAANASLIESQFGVRANPLTKAQQAQFATIMATASAQDQAKVLGKIEQAFGPRAGVIHEGLAKQGAAIQAHAGTLAAQGATGLSQSLLTGADLLKTNVVKQPSEDDVSRALFAGRIPSAFPTNPNAQAQILRAATARAAYLAAMAGQPDNTASFLGQAMKDVAPTGQWGATVVALPLGVTATQFADRMATITDTELDRMAGNVGGLTDLATDIRNQRVRLGSIGEGRYMVSKGTDWARLPNGQPLILDWNGIKPKPDERRGLNLEDLPPTGFDPSGR